MLTVTINDEQIHMAFGEQNACVAALPCHQRCQGKPQFGNAAQHQVYSAEFPSAAGAAAQSVDGLTTWQRGQTSLMVGHKPYGWQSFGIPLEVKCGQSHKPSVPDKHMKSLQSNSQKHISAVDCAVQGRQFNGWLQASCTNCRLLFILSTYRRYQQV